MTFGGYSIQYDLSGNVTNIVSSTTTNRIVWTARNQITNMTGSVTASFLYDGFGRRITRTVAGTAERYHYDGLDIMLQKSSANAVRTRYFRGLGIDEPWQRIDVGGAGTNRVYLADALGSIVALTDTNRVIQTEYDYEPFGATTQTGSGNKNPYKFTAREDDGTGLYYYRARYYHPSLGRFISEDPIGYAGGDINLYAYVGNDPIQFIDPLGLEFILTEEYCRDAYSRCMQNVLSLTKDYGARKTLAKGGVNTACSAAGGYYVGRTICEGVESAGKTGVKVAGGAGATVSIFDIGSSMHWLWLLRRECDNAYAKCIDDCENR